MNRLRLACIIGNWSIEETASETWKTAAIATECAEALRCLNGIKADYGVEIEINCEVRMRYPSIVEGRETRVYDFVIYVSDAEAVLCRFYGLTPFN